MNISVNQSIIFKVQFWWQRYDLACLLFHGVPTLLYRASPCPGHTVCNQTADFQFSPAILQL